MAVDVDMDHGFPRDPDTLRQQLESLLREARCNEHKMQRLDALERQLIAADSLPDLIALLLEDYRQAFGIEQVAVSLVDAEQEIAGALAQEGRSDEFPGLHLFASEAELAGHLLDSEHPRLAAFVADSACPFADLTPPLASVATLPLRRQEKLLGVLHLGSADPERYAAGTGTDLLARLASIIAVCLDSALAKERARQAGLTDGLTGVHNRRYFDHRVAIDIAQAQRHGHGLACLLLDIDHFKRINDTHGHPVGDAVLRAVARTIEAQLRTGDTVARYGGEEFVILLPHTAGHHAREIAERIRGAIERQGHRLASGSALVVTASLGVAVLDTEATASGDPALHLLGRADAALYAAKHGGRNRVVSDALAAPASQTPAWPSFRLPDLGHWLRQWRLPSVLLPTR